MSMDDENEAYFASKLSVRLHGHDGIAALPVAHLNSRSIAVESARYHPAATRGYPQQTCRCSVNIIGTTFKPFEESSALITTGVFPICRHSMYLGMVLILTGLAVLMGTLAPFIVVYCILLVLIFVRTEERTLEEKFGEA